MSAKKLEHSLSPDASPVERMQHWIHGKYDRVINPLMIGGAAATGRGLNTAVRGTTEFLRSLFSRS